jgi:hypothetical protein
MPSCVALILSRDLRVIHPPELFRNPRFACSEVGRLSMLVARRRRPVEVHSIPASLPAGGLLFHLYETEYLEPWPDALCDWAFSGVGLRTRS